MHHKHDKAKPMQKQMEFSGKGLLFLTAFTKKPHQEGKTISSQKVLVQDLSCCSFVFICITAAPAAHKAPIEHARRDPSSEG